MYTKCRDLIASMNCLKYVASWVYGIISANANESYFCASPEEIPQSFPLPCYRYAPGPWLRRGHLCHPGSQQSELHTQNRFKFKYKHTRASLLSILMVALVFRCC